MIAKSQWIDLALLRAFEAEGTDAHRLCTIDNGWAERFGRDILISFRTTAARDGLAHELSDWGKSFEFPIGRCAGDECRSFQEIVGTRPAKFWAQFIVDRRTSVCCRRCAFCFASPGAARQKLRHDYSGPTDIFADETWRGISCGKRF